MRIVVANEPRAYREAVAEAVCRLRPQLEVTVVEPQELDEVIGASAPHVVVCSMVTAALEAGSTTWILLYPEGESRAVISMDGRRTTHTEVDLTLLLRVIDQSKVLPEIGETEFPVTSDGREQPGAYAEHWQQ